MCRNDLAPYRMASEKPCFRILRMLSTFIVVFVYVNAAEKKSPSTANCSKQYNNSANPITSDDKIFTEGDERIFSVYTSSPVTRLIRENATLSNMLIPAFDYIDKVWEVVKKRQDEDNRDPRACNLYNNDANDWATIMTDHMKIFQIGNTSADCFSQVDVMSAADDDEFSRQTARNIPQTFANTRKAIAHAFGAIKVSDDDENWGTTVFPMLDRRWKRSGQECHVDSIFAHRKNGTWYLRAAATNRKRNIFAPSYRRHFLQEFIPRQGREALTFNMSNIKTREWECSTTFVTMLEGTGYSVEADSFDDPVSPLAQAFRQNLVNVDISEDAITISNIAILALPMVMNFIPVAFVAHPHAAAMFVYILVTDIFSTIPFLAKGIELIRSSQPRREIVYAYFAGNNLTSTLQSWSVNCTGDHHFRSAGIAFVIVALLALLGGILLEFWAKHYMSRRAQRKQNSSNGPFGTIGLDIGRTKIFGVNRKTSQWRPMKRSAQYP